MAGNKTPPKPPAKAEPPKQFVDPDWAKDLMDEISKRQTDINKALRDELLHHNDPSRKTFGIYEEYDLPLTGGDAGDGTTLSTGPGKKPE